MALESYWRTPHISLGNNHWPAIVLSLTSPKLHLATIKMLILFGKMKLLCKSEKREHFGLSAKTWSIFPPVFILLLFFPQSFFAKTKCKFEFPDYSSCSLITSKLNQSVRAFFIHTVRWWSFNKDGKKSELALTEISSKQYFLMNWYEWCVALHTAFWQPALTVHRWRASLWEQRVLLKKHKHFICSPMHKSFDHIFLRFHTQN